MPRPPRRRVVRTRVASRQTQPAATKAASPSPAPAPAPAPPSEPSSDIYDVSDREKEKAAKRRHSMRQAKPPSSTTRSMSAASSLQAKAVEAARQRRDSAMDRLENMTSTTSDDANHSDGSVELGRKVDATPAHRRMTNLSGLDLDDDMFDDLDTTLGTAGPASAQRSADTSTLSTSHFRRRPRAGSFLSRDDGPIRPSSRAGPNTPGISSTFNIGIFKRRAREPSILGTARKPLSQRPEPEQEHESELSEHEEAAEEDEFAPEAESTPFKHTKGRSGEVEQARRASARTDANLRKRKSDEGHERRERPSPHAPGRSNPIESIEQSDSDIASQEPSLPPLPHDRTIPATPEQEYDEELLAPPLSSGESDDEPEVWPPLQSLAKGRTKRAASAVLRRTPVPDDNVSDISSPPSLTYSPNYPDTSPPPRQSKRTTRKAAAPKPEPRVTTADLAGMLPRRRQRNARGDAGVVGEDSDAEVDASGLGNDEDELSYLDVRARRRPAGPASRGNQSAARGRSRQRGRGKQTPASGKPSTRTYGRSSDKENRNDNEEEGGQGEDHLGQAGDDTAAGDGSQELVARMGDELKNAKRKFQEVDKWALAYEEMTQSSSPHPFR
ncbi:hypothetical protein DL764_004263 [Monosporascus ibericus]|uniref:Uncharacterized protein n=1 Tax=Monosporascus ibericus TaxID=155417 RepID=A0A4Q4THC9_9PEZI|nr:hypothetical protein DL764_004263 [Monosporascus ibericus]